MGGLLCVKHQQDPSPSKCGELIEVKKCDGKTQNTILFQCHFSQCGWHKNVKVVTIGVTKSNCFFPIEMAKNDLFVVFLEQLNWVFNCPSTFLQ